MQLQKMCNRDGRSGAKVRMVVESRMVLVYDYEDGDPKAGSALIPEIENIKAAKDVDKADIRYDASVVLVADKGLSPTTTMKRVWLLYVDINRNKL